MNVKKVVTVIGMLLQCTAVLAQQAAETDSNVSESLPPKVRDLLIQEMNAVHGATTKIMSALVMGHSNVVAENAQAIHDSFIMKQKMTEEDKAALLNTVPAQFVEQDRAFHQLSALLAQAAGEENHTQQVKYFSKMIDACVTCHSQFARGRFPGFSTELGSLPKQ